MEETNDTFVAGAGDSLLLDQEEMKAVQCWYKKRRWFLFIAIMNACFYLFEYSAVTITAYYYFKLTLKVENPKLYFSLATGAMYILAPFSAVYTGRYVDRTRNLQKTTLLLSFFNLVGNLMYVFPVFKWFPIFGRFLCGVPSGMRPAFSGNLISFIFKIFP